MPGAPAELSPGTIVAGRYRVEACIGRGGMGAVYLVRHTNTEERLALKVLHAGVVADTMAVERFRREARAPAQIDSDHVVRVTDADTAPELGGAPFLVMEYLKGRDLESEVSLSGALSSDRVLSYLTQVARALDKAHELGIVHRDLKPANLFLTIREDGSPCVKILDFGIAKFTGASALAPAAGQTGTGVLTGTPLFMSPEQIRGDTAGVGPPADIWALGLIAYHLLTGNPFWTATSLPMLVAQIAYEPLPLPSTRGSPFGPAFDAWFATACARDPAERFVSARAAVLALEGALGRRASYAGATAMALTTSAAPDSGVSPEPPRSVHVPRPAPLPLVGSLHGASVSAAAAARPKSRLTVPLVIGAAIVAAGGAATLFAVRGHALPAAADPSSSTVPVTVVSSASAFTPPGPSAPVSAGPASTGARDGLPDAGRAPAPKLVKPLDFSIPSPSAPPSAVPSVSHRATDHDLLNTQH